MSLDQPVERLWTGAFSAAEWSARLATEVSAPASAPVWAILERRPDAWLEAADREAACCFTTYEPGLAVGAYESGRVFAETFEIRWERRPDGRLAARFLGASGPVATTGWEAEPIDLLSGLAVRTIRHRLWGRRPGGAAGFAEGRIPRRLSYPVSDAAETVHLQVREYIEPNSGQIQFWRFAGLAEKP